MKKMFFCFKCHLKKSVGTASGTKKINNSFLLLRPFSITGKFNAFEKNGVLMAAFQALDHSRNGPFALGFYRSGL